MSDKNLTLTSLVLFLLSIPVHFMGYFSNYLYVVGWLLWMPGILLLLISFFHIRKAYGDKRFEINIKKFFKNKIFVIFVFLLIYGQVLFIISWYLMRDISSMSMIDNIYYIIDTNGITKNITYDEFIKYSLINCRMLSANLPSTFAFSLFVFNELKAK